MSRGEWFITPKTAETLTLHFTNKEVNEKLIRLAKRNNLNCSLMATKLVEESIDKALEESERFEYEMLNEDAKVDMIIDLKRQLEIAHRISGGREDA